MEVIKHFIDVILHLDVYLKLIVENYGTLAYLIIFLVIFCETGLVVTPFLPGDSLLFALGAFAATKALNLEWLFVILSVAAIVGNIVNYFIGRAIGPKVFHKENVRFLNREYLDRTHQFFEKYGGKTIILTRFVPIIRTFAPFVAGVGNMPYVRFMSYNIAGGLLWVSTFLFAGYFFGNIPVIKHNFTIVVFAIIIISILPAVIEYFRNSKKTS